jgi:hypothetical protein
LLLPDNARGTERAKYPKRPKCKKAWVRNLWVVGRDNGNSARCGVAELAFKTF